MTRVLHTGDTHLGYQQYHVPERREDFLAAFQQVAEDAIETDVEAVVHAGDLFHDRRPSLSDIMGALDVLRTLQTAEIPFLAVVGNHEGKRRAQWLDLFEDLGLATRLGRDPVICGDVALYGLDYVPRSKRETISYDFSAADEEYSALVTHGLFEPFPHGEWDVRDLLSSATVSFDALLLGDDHTPQTRRLSDPHETVLTYCGSTERVSATERDERGYNIVSFDEGVDVRRRGLETRSFVYIDVELQPSEGTASVRERVEQETLDSAVVIVSVSGDGDPITPATIEEAATDQGALAVRVTDQRELADETDETVAFADPDTVVEDRIRSLGLSPAAMDIDETVRSTEVADSTVADAVETSVRDRLESDDASSFEAAQTDDEESVKSPGPSRNSDSDTIEPAEPGGPEDQATMEEYL